MYRNMTAGVALLCLSLLVRCQTPVEDAVRFQAIPPEHDLARTPAPDLGYGGKYSRDQIALLYSRISALREKTLARIADRIGVFYEDRQTVAFEIRDRQAGDKGYSIRPQIAGGEMRWQIYLIAEHLVAGEDRLDFLAPKVFAEAIIAEKTHGRPLPEWFKCGAIYYGIDEDELVEQKFMALLLEDPRSLPEMVVGIGVGGPFREMESYLAFVYFKEVYGKAVLQKMVARTVSEGSDWEEELRTATGADFPTFEAAARVHAVEFLRNRYWPAILEYRNALRLYLQEKYLEAIPSFTKLLFQFPDSFMSGNLCFWIAMCYYRLERYLPAAQYLEECRRKYSHQCTHLSLAHYRYAMCAYHQHEIEEAIRLLADFIRDFPDHELCGSAYFFLAESFARQSQLPRAYHWYGELVAKFPGHPRAGEAMLQAGHIGKKLGWYGRAKKHYLSSLNTSLPGKERENVQKLVQEIDDTLQMGPPPALARHLETLAEGFSRQDAAHQEAVLEEMAKIGEMALPWLHRLSKVTPPSAVEELLSALAEIGSAGSTPVFVEILQKYPQFSCEVLVGLVQLGIPASFLEEIVSQALADVPEARRHEVSDGLEFVLWGASPALCRSFPDLVVKLNGTALQQLEVLETLAADAGTERIPVLLRLAQHGKSRAVQKRALESLIRCHDSRVVEVMRDLMAGDDEEIVILSVLVLAQEGEYPIAGIEKMLAGSVNARMAAVEVLGTSSRHRRLLIQAMEDPRGDIRAKAKEKLSLLPVAELESLTEAFLEENHSVYFYLGIVEILEKITQRKITYSPDMTSARRKQIVDSLEPDRSR